MGWDSRGTLDGRHRDLSMTGFPFPSREETGKPGIPHLPSPVVSSEESEELQILLGSLGLCNLCEQKLKGGIFYR